jgi:N-acetylneuraminic acid mutarotase
MNGRSSKPLFRPGAAVRGVGLLTAALALVGCGGHGSSNNSSFTIGGTISGLNANASVVLVNGATTVTITPTTTSTWVFPSPFPADSSYSVTVLTQPAGEVCEVTSGSSAATLTADVNNVTVACSNHGQWIWQGGSNTVNAVGIYGTQGATSASNVPGARYSASSWTDASGTFWLFGGVGYDSTGAVGDLDDLWQYSPGTGLWTWVSGGNADNASGVYGTQGATSASNVPGARYSASSWADSSGNLWLFGGHGYDSTGAVGDLNDLWEYSPSSAEWTWISGGDTDNASGAYGTLGAAAAGNVPGARQAANSWIDSSGNLWLFGGYGYGSTESLGDLGYLNDLWEYSPSSAEWTWISGGSGENAGAVYGTEGTASAGNVPGARQAASSWIDSSGNLWLLGGVGYDLAGSLGALNDLWQYTPSTGQWTWVDGSNTPNDPGAYGAQGTTSASTAPGARYSASSWIDSSGNFWLFGGAGYGSTGNGYLNDLWQFEPP